MQSVPLLTETPWHGPRLGLTTEASAASPQTLRWLGGSSSLALFSFNYCYEMLSSLLVKKWESSLSAATGVRDGAVRCRLLGSCYGMTVVVGHMGRDEGAGVGCAGLCDCGEGEAGGKRAKSCF